MTKLRLPTAHIRVFSLAVLMLASWCIAGCSPSNTPDSSPSRPSRTTHAADPNAVFAYRTGTEIGLVRGNQVVARASGNFMYPQFTADRRYLFAYSLTNSDLLSVINTETNKADTRRVSSGRSAPGQGSSIIWWQNPNQLISLDLSNPASAPTTVREIDLPPAPGGRTPTARVLATYGEMTLLARLDSPGGVALGPDNLYLAKGGTVTPLGTTAGDESISRAVVSPDGQFIAYATSQRQCGRATVGLIDVNKGTTTSLQLPSSVAADTHTAVRWLWWGADNKLHASFSSKQCKPPYDQSEPFKDPSFWTLINGQWQKEQSGVYQKLDISPDVVVLLAPSRDGGTLLSVEDRGSTTDIATNVQYVAVP